MPKNQENVKVTYDHEVDRMKDKRDPLKATYATQPNAGLAETITALGDKNRMQCEYVIGKSPQEKFVSPRTIEAMRPPKAESKNG